VAEHTLRITTEEPEDVTAPGWATLVLRREPAGADEETGRRAALRRVLHEGGTVRWSAPLDPRLLLEVLEDRGAGAPPGPAHAPAPDLASAPHAWLVVEPDTGRLVGANEEARALLDLPPAGGAPSFREVALPGRLRAAVLEESEGIRPADHIDGGRMGLWWTDAHGRRVVCLVRSPLDRTVQELRNQQSLARIGQMTATLAHEIRNPVASVAGALDLLEHEEDPDERLEILRMAHARLTQMRELLEQTLHLARPIEGPPERIEAQSVIHSAMATVRLNPQFADTRIESHEPTDPIEVRCYPQPLVQALVNLLLNASQAQGGEGRIEITLQRDGRRAFIRVQDEGPGIPPDKREEVFKPFYTTKTSGTGLGLPEVRRAMEAMGGAVTVEDVPKGACLCLELPLAL
jgi:signal transduction histidine kinase